MATVLHSAPRFTANDGHRETLVAALGDAVLASKEQHGEILLTIARDGVADALRTLRDVHDYQQLMDIAGVDYPDRAERFEVVYMLLSLTKNHRIIVKVSAAENTPVPTVTTLWPNAGWLEREVFDLFGVIFDGNTDLRRILTDYGFEGHPFRKDFPLTGYQEVRYSEELKRVVYEPVSLPQEYRRFEFMSPWEGADYVLPGDEKAVDPGTPQTPPVVEVKTTDTTAETGAGTRANTAPVRPVTPGAGLKDSKSAHGTGQPVPEITGTPEPGAPEPTESRPGRPPRKGKSPVTSAATEVEPRDPTADESAEDAK